MVDPWDEVAECFEGLDDLDGLSVQPNVRHYVLVCMTLLEKNKHACAQIAANEDIPGTVEHRIAVMRAEYRSKMRHMLALAGLPDVANLESVTGWTVLDSPGSWSSWESLPVPGAVGVRLAPSGTVVTCAPAHKPFLLSLLTHYLFEEHVLWRVKQFMSEHRVSDGSVVVDARFVPVAQFLREGGAPFVDSVAAFLNAPLEQFDGL